MNDVPDTLLQECLDLVEQGESIEQILARYPEAADSLRPFLMTAQQLATLAPQPSLAAKHASQKAFLAHADALKVAQVRPSSWYRLRQILLPLASLAVVLILFGVTAVSVSGSAIPGDALYSVKRLVENVRLNQVDDAETAVALMDAYRQERIREVQTLLRTGRTADVSFEGEVEAIQAEEWRVAAVEVMVDAETTIEGEPQLGELARVTGKTENGFLNASLIEMLTGSGTPPETTPEPTALPTATATLAPTETMTAAPTTTATATATPEPTATMMPTATNTPPATAVPAQPPGNDNDEDDDDGDNANDDGSSNENDSDDGSSGSGGDDDSGGNDNDDDNDNGNDNDDDNDNDDNENDNDDNDNDNDDNENDNDGN